MLAKIRAPVELNDDNFPFSAGRNAGLPDDTELIVVRVPSLR